MNESNEQHIESLLDQLQGTAETLEQESRSIPEILEGVQQRLRTLHLGLDAWVTGQPLSIQHLSVSASTVAPRIEVQLGFALPAPGKGGERALVIREAAYVPDPELPADGACKLARVLKVKLLSQAPREEQMAALSRLPDLIGQLNAELQSRTDAIRSARKIIE